MSYHAAKTPTVPGILSLILLLAGAAGMAKAQTLSNLGSSNSYEAVAQGFWVAQPFTTGSDASGYTLTNVSLQLNAERFPAGGGGDGGGPTAMPLSVSIYSSSGGSVGTLVANGLLTGATYPTTGTDVWTTASGSPVLLSSSTEYFLVATTSASPEEYNWAFVTGDQSTSNDGWAIPAGYDYSLNQGGSWGQSTATALFSVTAADATAAPEPGTWKCLIAALAVTGMVRVIRRRAGKIFIEWATNLR